MWHLSSELRNYLEPKFTTYKKDSKVKKITKQHPPPTHSFLKTYDLDSDLEENIERKLGYKAKAAKGFDTDQAWLPRKRCG